MMQYQTGLIQNGKRRFSNQMSQYWSSFGHHGVGPCRMIRPIVDQLAKDFAGKFKLQNQH